MDKVAAEVAKAKKDAAAKALDAEKKVNEAIAKKVAEKKAAAAAAKAEAEAAAAVAAVPAKDEQFAYLSSGTWSLMGIETKAAVINNRSYELNFTNEGGIEGTTRFLKNICGMWLYERCRKEFKDSTGKPLSAGHQELQASAMQVAAFRSIFNPDDKVFANPPSMIEAIQQYAAASSTRWR